MSQTQFELDKQAQLEISRASEEVRNTESDREFGDGDHVADDDFRTTADAIRSKEDLERKIGREGGGGGERGVLRGEGGHEDEEDGDDDDDEDNDPDEGNDSELDTRTSGASISFGDLVPSNETNHLDLDGAELKAQPTFPHINASGFEPNPTLGAFLKTVPVLRTLTQVECDILGGAMAEQLYEPQDVIIKQDSIGDGFYILRSGCARVMYTDPKTKAVKLIDDMSSCDYFGEAALLNNAARGASVVALEHCVALFLHRDHFQRLFTMPDGNTTIPFAKRKVISSAKVISPKSSFFRLISNSPSSSETVIVTTKSPEAASSYFKEGISAPNRVCEGNPEVSQPVSQETVSHKQTNCVSASNNQTKCMSPASSILPAARKSIEIRQPVEPDRTKPTKIKAMLFNALKGHVLFAGMEDAHKEKIIDQMWRTKVQKGSTIIEQGELGDNLYVLEKGKLDVQIRTADGKGTRKVATISKAGHCFGELALLYDTPRAATIIATSKSALWVLDRITFRRILRNVSEVKLKQYENFLASVPLLAPLSNSERSKVAEALESQFYKDGELIVSQGEKGESMFFIASGTVSVTKVINGEEVEVNRLKEGDYFGERCLLHVEANLLNAVTAAAATLDSTQGSCNNTSLSLSISSSARANSPGGSSVSSSTATTVGRLSSEGVISPVAQQLSPSASSISTSVSSSTSSSTSSFCSSSSSSYHSGIWSVVDQNGIRTANVRCVGRVEVVKLDRYAFQLLLGPVTLHLKKREEIYEHNEGEAIARRNSGILSPTSQSLLNVAEPVAEAKKSDKDLNTASVLTQPSTLRGNRYNLDDFVVLGFLGKGGYGHVELVEHKVTKETFALKTLYRSHIVKTKSQSNILNEKRMLTIMDSPHIVRCYETYKDEYKLYFLLEPALGGELYTLLRMRSVFNDKTAKFYAASVILALEEIHRHDVVYRDLKPENLLLDAEGYIKITDFGLSKIIPEGRTFTVCGTPHYLAPEIIAGVGHNKSVDFWCLGVLIYELLTGQPPFYRERERADHLKLYRRIAAGDYPHKPEISEDAWHLISNLLQVRPSARLGVGAGGFDRLKRHPWFNSIDWAKLQTRKLRAPIIPFITADTDLHNFKKPTTNYHRELEALAPEDQHWDDTF